jgi:DNA-binding transcriptional ArsR family regulator
LVIALIYQFHIIAIMKALDAIATLSALASESRLAVYRLLVKRGPEGYTPSELAKRLDLPAPTLSFHLRGLTQAGLVISRRESRNLFYSPNFERMNTLVSFLTDNCCSLAETSCGTDCKPVAAPVQQRKRA